MSKQKRRVRLFGTGQTNDRFGGGMPIPSMVSQMLDHLQDNGPTPIADLVAMVEQRHHKRERLEYVYHKGHKLDGDAYALFIDDVIAELEAAEVAVRQDGDRLTLGPAFKLGERLPLPDGMGAIVYEKSAREVIGRASLHDLEIKSLANDLHRDRPGIRTINKDNVERLAESMRAFGYLEHCPVLIDQHGRILSGRHRIKGAELAGVQYVTRVIEVESDREALAIAFVMNEGAGFSRIERERIAKRLSAAGLDVEHIGEVIGQVGKRRAIEAKLLADPGRSDRQIAKEVGASNSTVGIIRRELESNVRIAHSSERVASDGRVYHSREPKPPNPETASAKVTALVEQAGPEGITAEEARAKLPDVKPLTIGSTLNKLAKEGHIAASDTKRPPENGGRPATVYVSTKDQPSAPAPADPYEVIVDKILKLARDLPASYRTRVIQQLSQVELA